MNKRGRESSESNIDVTKCLMLVSQHLETSSDVFDCKTCHRQFSSYQALGGHRASHQKKTKSIEDYEKQKGNDSTLSLSLALPMAKRRMHECGICGKGFGKGQALGGHMRKHKASIYDGFTPFSDSITIFSLDLNLTPLENDFKALFGNLAPKLS